MPPRTPPDLSSLKEDQFNLWFGLKSAAGEANWRKLAECIDSTHPAPILRHDLTVYALREAALAGESLSVAKMIARGYVPELGDLTGILKEMEAKPFSFPDGLPAALKAIASTKDFDLRPAIFRVLSSDAVAELLPQLRLAKIDIFCEGQSLGHVLGRGSATALAALVAHGVSPFSPTVIRHMTAPLPEDATDAAREQRDEWEMLCTHNNGEALAIMKRRPLEAESYRAGLFLNPYHLDANGEPVTLLGVLIGLGMQDRIFADVKRWEAHPAEAEMVMRALVDLGAGEGQTLGPLGTHLRQKQLSAKAARKPGLRL